MCTNLMLAFSNTIITARAFELQGQSSAKPWLPTNIYKVPQNSSFGPTSAADGVVRASPNKYGFIGVAEPETVALGQPCFIDGLNQNGLSCGALWLPGTEYPSFAPGRSDNLPFYDIGRWALGNYSTVAEVEAALADVHVFGAKYDPRNLKNGYLPLHFIFTDNTGASLILEFLGGEMKIHRSDDGVLTNSPGYEWQRTNLKNYHNLSVVGRFETSTGDSGPPVGNQLVGLPGDIMSASRFIRASILRKGIEKLSEAGVSWLPPLGADSGVQTVVNTAMQLVQMVMETPYGTVLYEAKGEGNPLRVADYTQWSVTRDHSNLVYYYTTAFSGIMRGIDLNAVDLTPGAQIASIPLLPTPTNYAWYEDMSRSFSPPSSAA